VVGSWSTLIFLKHLISLTHRLVRSVEKLTMAFFYIFISLLGKVNIGGNMYMILISNFRDRRLMSSKRRKRKFLLCQIKAEVYKQTDIFIYIFYLQIITS